MRIGIKQIAIPPLAVGEEGTITPPAAPDPVTETYDTPGEFTTTVPADQPGRDPYTVALFRVWAPGGGGGQNFVSSGGSGGAGGFAFLRKTVAAAEQHRIEVGNPGDGGASGADSGVGGGGGGVTGVYQPTVGIGNEVLIGGSGAGGGGGNSTAPGGDGGNGGGDEAAPGETVQGEVPDPTLGAGTVSVGSSGVVGTASASSLSQSLSVSASTNCLVLQLSSRGNPGDTVFTSVTYNGQNCTIVANEVDPAGITRSAIAYLNNPPSGSNTVSVQTVNAQQVAVGYVQLEDVDTTDPIDATGVNSENTATNSPDASCTTTGNDKLMIDCVCCDGGATSGSPNSGQTENADQQVGNLLNLGGYKAIPTAGAQAHEWITNVNNNRYSMSMAAFNGAGAASPDAIRVESTNIAQGGSNANFNINVLAGSNRGIVVNVVAESTSEPSAVTVGGTACDRVGGFTVPNGPGTTCSQWVLSEADITTGNMAVSVTQGGGNEGGVDVVQLTNWDQVLPTGSDVGENGANNVSSVNVTATSPSVGSAAVACGGHGNSGNDFSTPGGTGTWVQLTEHGPPPDGSRQQVSRQYFNSSQSVTCTLQGGGNTRYCGVMAFYSGAASGNGEGGTGGTQVAGGTGGSGSNNGTNGAQRLGGDGGNGDGTANGGTGAGGTVGGGDAGQSATKTLPEIAGGSGAGAGAGLYGGGGGGSAQSSGGGGAGGGSGFAAAEGTLYRTEQGAVPATADPNYANSAAEGGAPGATGSDGGPALITVTYCGEFDTDPQDIITQNLQAWFRPGLGLRIGSGLVDSWDDQLGNIKLTGSGGVEFDETDQAVVGDGVDAVLSSPDTIQSLFGNQRFSIFVKCTGELMLGGDSSSFNTQPGEFNYAAGQVLWTPQTVRRTMTFIHDGTNLIVRRAGAQIASGAIALNALVGAATWRLLQGDSAFSNGEIEQVFFYTHPTNNLTLQEVETLEAFLDEGLCPLP